jgi:hypothetical protein
MKPETNLMRTLPALLAVCLASSSAPIAQAQQAAPSGVPANFQFAGSYTCTGAFGNGKVHRSTYTGAVTLGGKWLQLTEQDVEPATGYLAEYLIGYDPQRKRLVEFDANNFGAATYASEAGWSNGVLTMASPVSSDPKAPYAANRFVYSLSGADSFTVDWQVSKTAALEWVQADHLSCRRNTSAPA